MLPLGHPLPADSDHSISVSFPLWEHVIAYEKNDPHVHNALLSGYPRFFIHSYVNALVQTLTNQCRANKTLSSTESLLILPTLSVAKRFLHFISYNHFSSSPIPRLLYNENTCNHYAVAFPSALDSKAKAYWQHTGEILSSRHAQSLLHTHNSRLSCMRASETHQNLALRIAQLYQIPSSSVYLYPTGMAAIFAALRTLLQYHTKNLKRKKAKPILVSFPYVDTLKIFQRQEFCPDGMHFLYDVKCESFYDELRAILEAEAMDICGIFAEFPSNPLLESCDIERIAALAHEYGTFLVVDDTIGSFNVNAMEFGCADMIVTSLTKIFSGTGTVMGGSLLLRDISLDILRAWKESLLEDSFVFEKDAQVLLSTSERLDERLETVNDSAFYIAKQFQTHSLVEIVYYPAFDPETKRMYERFRVKKCKEVGFGPVISVQFKEKGKDENGMKSVAQYFYDALQLAKGPTLGTDFTICCPYTMLAHYSELPFVESCSVHRCLVRFSIGLEPKEIIWDAIKKALTMAASKISLEGGDA